MAAVIDPVAQTFFVDAGKYPKGVFMHSVDLVFSRKDTVTYQPFKVQLRPTVNGYPHSTMIHSGATMGEVSKLPESIKIVDILTTVPDLSNPLHYTRFEFSAPVHLLPGEHAMVMYTNSDNYSVYVSEIGDVRLGDTTGRRIDKQPFTGSFFKSQNGSTYTAFQQMDLMFRLNFCQFDTAPRTIYTDNLRPLANLEYDIIKLTSQDLVFQNTNIEYSFRGTSNNNPSAGLDPYYTDVVLLKDYTAADRKIILENKKSAEIKAIISTNDVNVGPMIDIERLGLVATKFTINDCGLQSSNFNILVNGTGYTDNAVVTITGLNNKGSGATANAVYDPATGFIESIEVINPGAGYVDGIIATVAPPAVPAGNTTATVYIDQETANKGGPALARYITRNVTLNDGFDANMIRVYLTAYQPSGSTIEVYYKVLADEDPTPLNERPYVRMKNVQQGDETLLNTYRSQVERQFLEFLFIPETDDVSYVGLDNDVSYANFKTFVIKIVMRTTNPIYSPIVRDLRAIALAP